ncbi:hypothetical protein POM88_028897 [Heracleum sosnowskyi]|uniref:Uncharacterized protein n=1 Tax=Heracleum sosnowskyi TaxID=360622 RepID=A0AAD8HTZ9_9APIA|nr:hypothetical protein POM88_028897 [Heracleum sosnowskyi]
MLYAVKGTPLLKLSSKTIQVLQRITDLSRYPPSPLSNVNFLYLQGQGLKGKPTRSTDHVINYLFGTSPSIEILIAICGRKMLQVPLPDEEAVKTGFKYLPSTAIVPTSEECYLLGQ